MSCSRELTFHFIDGFLLVIVFLFQSVVLNFFIISHFRASSLTYLWFLCDFICLFVFSITLFLAYQKHSKLKQREKHNNSLSLSNSFTSTIRTNSRNGNRSNHSDEYSTQSCNVCPEISKLPLGYMTWLFYSTILVVKVLILFKSEIPQTLKPQDVFGPQMLKLGIGVSAFIFSLLVEAHHNSQRDQIRAAAVKWISYGMALEILDTVSFLSLLIGSESHLIYTYNFENMIIVLSSVNLMLPALGFYKLTVSNFGRTYPIPLETVYKVLHLLLVNVSYFAIRVYLWKLFSVDTSIFFVKNIYAILTFIRDVYPDIKNLQLYFQRKRNRIISNKSSPTGDQNHSFHANGNGNSRTNGKISVNNKMDRIDEEVSIGLASFKPATEDHEDASRL